MKNLITIWEMNLEKGNQQVTKEELATWPSEPYQLEWEKINWN